MKLSSDLLKKFANEVNAEHNKYEIYVYGKMVSGKNGEKCVLIDGMVESTPVTMGMDAEPGDRVMIMINNHEATVISNLSSPASARTASSYMKMLPEGLAVGKIENDELSGSYSLMKSDGYSICLPEGYQVDMELLDDDVFSIYIPGGTLGLRSQSFFKNFRINADVFCKNDDDDHPLVGLQTYSQQIDRDTGKAIGNKTNLHSLIVGTDNGVDIIVPSTKKPAINGYEIITAEKSIIVFGTIKATGTIDGGGYKRINATVSVPDGYVLCGISEITSNHISYCQLTTFRTNSSTNQISASFYNRNSNSLEVTITFKWFAILKKGIAQDISDSDITF